MHNTININNTNVELSTKENSIFTNTKDIAEVFGKKHSDMLKVMKRDIAFNTAISAGQISLRNYQGSDGKEHVAYDLNRDMFMYFVMGFTGESAKKWKLDFITAFNKMEQLVVEQQQQLITLQKEASDKLLLAKDKEIERLNSERKLCKLREDGSTSVRGIAQRTNFSEKQIRECFKSLGGIKQTVKHTLYWKVEDDLKGLITKEGEYGTPYFILDSAISILEQYYIEE